MAAAHTACVIASLSHHASRLRRSLLAAQAGDIFHRSTDLSCLHAVHSLSSITGTGKKQESLSQHTWIEIGYYMHDLYLHAKQILSLMLVSYCPNGPLIIMNCESTVFLSYKNICL